MKKTFAILLASTALAVAVGAGIPAWSAMHGAELTSVGTELKHLVQLADDDHEASDHEKSARSGHDDDGDDEDDDDGGNAAANPAPAGTVLPPANGLFGSGAAPKVKVN
jgi:hypothetical protein